MTTAAKTAASIELAAGLVMNASEAATQTFGAITSKGGGKSYLAGKFAEGLYDAGAPFAVLDPVGNWSALTLGRDGKSAGLGVVVIGGDRGDVELREETAEAVGALLVERGISAVVDVSELSKTRRKVFVAGFCEALFRAAKKRRSPYMVIFEEAQLFAPQQCQPGEQRMLGAVTDIVRLGRNYGLGSMLVSQRPQSVSKEVLNQVECLFVGQLRGAQERKAIASWVTEQGVDIKTDLESLPALKVGEFYCWSPSWLRVFRLVKIGQKRTFDGSRTPVLGLPSAPVAARSERSIEAAVKALGALYEASVTEDETPRGIRESLEALEPDQQASFEALQRKNDKLEADNTAAWERIYQAEEHLKDLSVILTDAAAAVVSIKEKLAEADDFVPTGEDMAAERITRCVVERHRETELKAVSADLERQLARDRLIEKTKLRIKEGRGAPSGQKKLDKADQAILDVLGWQKAPIGKRKLALLAGYSASGGGFNNALGRLRQAGRIEGSRELTITKEGRQLAQKSSMPASGRALFDWWAGHSRVDGCMQAILMALRQAGIPLHPDALAVAAGYKPKTGGFSNGLGRLRTLGLVEGKGKVPVSLAKELR